MHQALRKYCCLLLLALLPCAACDAGSARPLLDKGWQALVRDNDTEAMQLFGQAYIEAERTNDTADKAQALLYMGICNYSISYTRGMEYALRAMDEYRKMEQAHPMQALEGRSRCLQLVSTINSRQGKYKEAIALSKEALKGFPANDTTGITGLTYNSLGFAYAHLGMGDSATYYNTLALTEQLRANNLAYLPMAYMQVAAIETANKNKLRSLVLYTRALRIADSTANRQAQVYALLGLGEWQIAFEKDYKAAKEYYHDADSIANTLTDKSFKLNAASHLLSLYKETGDYKQAISCQELVTKTRDSMYSWDRRKELKSLEIQFDVAEKDRQLKLVQKQKEVTTLANYLLWGGVGALLIISSGIILSLRRINRRDKLLLQAKESLVAATEEKQRMADEQKHLKERQMQQELEYKESQLSAMALQMLQKNELMQELKERLDENKAAAGDHGLNKIINKGLAQDKEWTDFNTYFESVNKNFYARLKQEYADISPNDLKICALIKLNLSIKEMAAILNISPDSVKTARYRLRKKLQLNNEDNLTEFIMGL